MRGDFRDYSVRVAVARFIAAGNEPDLLVDVPVDGFGTGQTRDDADPILDIFFARCVSRRKPEGRNMRSEYGIANCPIQDEPSTHVAGAAAHPGEPSVES